MGWGALLERRKKSVPASAAPASKGHPRLYLSSSNYVVNESNFVKPKEKEVFFNTLNKNNIEFTHFDNLNDCLLEVYKKADKKDIILLIGAQGMDPAKSLLDNII